MVVEIPCEYSEGLKLLPSFIENKQIKVKITSLIKKLRELIDCYNEEVDKLTHQENQKQIIAIQDTIHLLDWMIKPINVARASTYKRGRETLLNRLNHAYRETATQIIDIKYLLRATTEQHLASLFLDLFHNTNKKVTTIFKLWSSILPKPQKKIWQNFLLSHQLTVLSRENSVVLKVTSNTSHESQVIKLESWPKYDYGAAVLLAEKKPTFFVQETMNRTYYDHRDAIQVSILPYFSKGNLLEYATRQSNNLRMKTASKLFINVIDLFLQIESLGFSWTDGKVTNILVAKDDTKENVRFYITDTKGFIIDTKTPLKQGKHITTPAYIPPEYLKTTRAYSKDFHTYIVGVNLFEYLFCRDTHDERHIKFTRLQCQLDKAKLKDKPFTQNKIGQYYADIIEGLTCDEPQNRLNLLDAKARLYNILLANNQDDALIALDNSYREFTTLLSIANILDIKMIDANDFYSKPLAKRTKILKALSEELSPIINAIIAQHHDIITTLKFEPLPPHMTTLKASELLLSINQHIASIYQVNRSKFNGDKSLDTNNLNLTDLLDFQRQYPAINKLTTYISTLQANTSKIIFNKSALKAQYLIQALKKLNKDELLSLSSACLSENKPPAVEHLLYILSLPITSFTMPIKPMSTRRQPIRESSRYTTKDYCNFMDIIRDIQKPTMTLEQLIEQDVYYQGLNL